MNKKNVLSILLLLGGCIINNNVQAQKVEPLEQIYSTQITSGDMKSLEQKDIEFIMSLNTDKLLYHFRQRANLSQSAGISAYGGWESSDLRGHTLGHYLSALSILYAQSGNTEAKKRINQIINTLGQVQTATGKGYLSAFDESMLDRVESDGSGWAPYYTLHKILQGVIDAYVYGGNEKALDVASKFGTYIYNRTTRLTNQAAWENVLDIMEVGGFAEAMLNLHKLTGNEGHLKAGQFFQQMSKLKPSAEGLDILADTRTYNFHHSNSTIPQFIAAEREYEITGNTFMLDAARNFWDNVIEHRSYCNGSTSYKEHWNLGPDQIGKELDYLAGESCCTHNLIRLSNDLFRMLRNPKYAEYVERATLNHIMGSINPDNCNFMYFHTQLPGSFKSFGKNTEVFWCCTGTGMENHVRYNQSAFFKSQDTLYVCQFFPTQLTWEEKGLKIEQTSDFPHEEHAKFSISEGSANATFKIRIPTWTNGFEVKVNGTTSGATDENGFWCINRTWKAGDNIEISLPMHLRLEEVKNTPRTHAIFYGPLVLAGDLGTEGVTFDRVNQTDNFFNGYPSYMAPSTPVPLLTGSTDTLDWIVKTEGKTEFTTTATSDNSNLRLIPLYKAVGIRFADYWKFAGDLHPAAINYPTAKTNATQVTELEDGVEYVLQNSNTTLSNRNFFWDGINLRTQSNGSIEDVKVQAKRHEVGGETYWSFQITSSQYNNQYLGRTNHANVQATSTATLWTATYEKCEGGYDREGDGFELLLRGDAPDGGHEMMMNGDATWVVAWKDDRGTDYTDKTSHWSFFKVEDLKDGAMDEYNETNLQLYKYLVEAAQMYDRGIKSIAESYNKGVTVYTDPNNTLEQLQKAIEDIRNAIKSTISEYEEGEPATYGIINPGFENLTNQKNIASNDVKSVPFGWTLEKDGTEVSNPTWWWCSINKDGNQHKEGEHVWGIWDGGAYGDIELHQTLTGVTNGHWRLTARLMNNHSEQNNHARIFINNASMLAGNKADYSWLPSGEECTFSGTWATADNDMQHVFQVETEVTDGTLRIGAKSNGFIKIDDFQLTYLGPSTSIDHTTVDKANNSSAVYDLTGRHVSNTSNCLKPGIYIAGGKKILIK